MTNPVNIRYLTGLCIDSPTEREAFLILDQNRLWLLTDGRYLERAKKIPYGEVVLLDANLNLTRFLKKKISQNNWQTLAYEKKDLKVFELERLTKSLSGNLVGTADLVEKLREIKTPQEITFLTRAARLTDQVFEQARSKIKPGMTELEAALLFQELFVKVGAAGQAFPPIVAAGQNTSVPHHLTSAYRIKKNDPVLVDFGLKVNGYCSDLTRMIFLGKPTPDQQKIYALVRLALETALAQIKPGMTGHQADRIARDVIKKQGYGRNFLHSLGHSVGLQIHDGFRLGPKSKTVLRPGMVFTIEPGIYLPGEFGIRLEDLVVLEKNGARLLSHSPK